MRKPLQGITAIIGAGLFVSGCAYNGYYDRDYAVSAGGGYYGQDYRSGNGYQGDHDYAERYRSPFTGRGAALLDPWLSDTREGQTFVQDHYDVGPRGEIGGRDAESANIFFRRWADTNRDYRLTDAEIRTALVHTRNGYGLRR